jgi:hypothetical protein
MFFVSNAVLPKFRSIRWDDDWVYCDFCFKPANVFKEIAR